MRRTVKYRNHKARVKTRRRKLKYKNIGLLLGVICVLGIGIFSLFQLPIQNIYVTNNYYLTENEIIDTAGLSDYPKSYQATAFSVRKRLINNPLVKNVKVTKKLFTSIHIEVIENRPIFYDTNRKGTVLLDNTLIEDKFVVPVVINYIPDTIYNQFIENMVMVYPDVLERISEIKYDPNDVDNERFLLFMDDGNYVYLTLDKFKSINNYIDIVKKFGSKKGILYLDSGEYFKILEG